MAELFDLDASRVTELVHNREISPLESVQACLARIEALNGAVNAFVASSHASLPANRLYESSGFQLVDHQHNWVKMFSSPAT